MVRKKYKKKVLPLLVIISAIIFTGLIGAITFQQIAPTTNPFVTPDNTVNLSWGVHCPDGCSSFTESWNGTNTTIFDYQWVLGMNFNNFSALGENDTIVKDISMYGNNGTVVGGENITWTANGKYGGTFNFSGEKNIGINITNSESLNISTEYTISFWIYLLNYTLYDSRILSKGGHYGVYLNANTGNLRFGSAGLDDTMYSGTSKLPIKQWIHVVINYNGTYYNAYLNGYLNGTDTASGTPTYNLEPVIIGNSNSGSIPLNGSIDDIMIFNKTLTADEIQYLSRTQITKHNSTYFEYNVTNNNNSITAINNFLCSANLTGFETCSATQSISQGNTLSANFSNFLGTVRNDFYGVNTHGYYLSDAESWNQQVFLDSGMKYIRADMELESHSASEGNYDFSKFVDLVVWAKANNVKIIWVASYMPDWLADKTTTWCDSDAWETCSPSNYTKWGELVVDFLNYVSCDANTCEVEVWNEPNYEGFWLNTITTTTNTTRSVLYNQLYNATYLAVKGLDSNYQVGGIGVVSKSPDSIMMMRNWLSSYVNQTDFVSYHRYLGLGSYEGFTDFYSALDDDYSWIYANITEYGGNVSRVIISEWNINNVTVMATDINRWEKELGLAYLVTLNQYPENISLIQYQFAATILNNYQMINKTLNTTYASYNVTKNFAHLLLAGKTDIKQSSSDSECLKIVSGNYQSLYAVIVINTCNYPQNAILNMSMENGTVKYPYTSIMNYETGASIPVSTSGIAQLGVLDSYEILYLYSGLEEGAVLTNQFKFNEATGTRVYDLLQNTSDGTVSGASWVNDGLYRVLNSSTYTIDLVTGLLTLDTDYLYEYLFVDYGYNKVFGFHVSILGVIAGFLMIIVLGVGIIYVVKYFKNIKELE